MIPLILLLLRDDNMISYLSDNNERTIAINQYHMFQVGDHVSFRVRLFDHMI